MKRKQQSKKRKIFWFSLAVITLYLIINAIRIHSYASVYSEKPSDVAIVLGAGTKDGKLSPVYKERVNHGIYLYAKGVIKKLILTGGVGKKQILSDSQVAKNYALKKGIPEKDILIEEQSKYTYENITASKKIMADFGYQTALLVSDPLHMKRAMKLAKVYDLQCESSPTKTSRFKSTYTKTKFLIYETMFFSLREIISLFQ
ncbi:MAG: YdcF family protein [Putridiphycobacter sp.]